MLTDFLKFLRSLVQGGDEARVARARGSGRGALSSITLANGTPSSSVPPPRAGWAVRITEATRTPTSGLQSASCPGSPRGVERWASERESSSGLSDRCAASPSPEGTTTTTAAAGARGTSSGAKVFSTSRLGGHVNAGLDFENRRQEEADLEAKKKEEYRNHQQQQSSHHHQPRRSNGVVAHCQVEHLELRGWPMSQKNAIPPLSRPPPSQTAAAASTGAFVPSGVIDATGDLNNGSATTDDGDAHPGRPARVHDHNRPFPPPRLPAVVQTNPPPPPNPNTTVRSASPSGETRTPATTRVLVTAPLTPLSSTFRSRPSLRQPQSVVEASNEANTRGLLPTTETTAPPRSPVGAVSLTVPRPDVERTINEYVEAPFKHCCNQDRRVDEGKRPGDCPKTERRHRHKGLAGLRDSAVAATHRQQRHSRNQVFRGLSPNATSTATSGSIIAGNTTTANAVTKQPVSFTKEPASTLASRAYDPAGLSIMCDFCGRCRCESCREPPPLPSRWLCDNSCYCSADTILDYASCLCCVKGLFYHCADGSSAGGIDGEAAGSCADEPCSCTGTRRTSRWACLSALTLVMPCLLCYWPLKGCVAVCETCYARHASQGCKCNPNTLGNNARHHPIASDIGDSRDPEKRLLDPVTPEL